MIYVILGKELPKKIRMGFGADIGSLVRKVLIEKILA
jgi:hypothetical protein